MKNSKLPLTEMPLMMWPIAMYKKNPALSVVNKKKFRFAVYITDNPGNYAGLETEITGVEVFIKETGWVSLHSNTQMVQVLQLTNGKEILLGSRTDLSSHLYSKLKLVFGSNNQLTVKRKNGILEEEKIYMLKYEGSSEVVIDLENNTSSSILLDFNVAQSVKRSGDEYILKPVINLIKDVKTGVSGQLNGVESAAVCLKNDMDVYDTYVNTKGEFLLRGIKEGVYDLTVILQNEHGKLPAVIEPQLKDISVIKGQITDVGSLEV